MCTAHRSRGRGQVERRGPRVGGGRDGSSRQLHDLDVGAQTGGVERRRLLHRAHAHFGAENQTSSLRRGGRGGHAADVDQASTAPIAGLDRNGDNLAEARLGVGLDVGLDLDRLLWVLLLQLLQLLRAPRVSKSL